jgi:hypothetical protein
VWSFLVGVVVLLILQPYGYRWKGR